MKIYFLFNIPSPLSWSTDQVANIISLIGAIATVWTLIYAIRQGIKNSKKINDLAKITEKLSEQNELLKEQNKITRIQLKDAALPILTFKEYKKTGSSVWLYFVNEGNRLKVTKTEDMLDNMTLMTSGSDVLPGKDFVIYPTWKKGIKEKNKRFQLQIEYTDIYGNPYSFVLTGNKDVVTSYTNPQRDHS